MKFLSTFLLILGAFVCLGQQKQLSKKQPAIYAYHFYRNDGSIVSSLDSADYVQMVTEPDSGSKLFNVREFYTNEKPRFIGKSTRVFPVFLVEQSISFYPNGGRKLMTNYSAGKPSGISSEFYPNGKVYMVKEYFLKDSTKRAREEASSANRDSLIKALNDSTGKPMVENGIGHVIVYDTGFKTILEEGSVRNGRMDGIWKGKDLTRHLTFEEDYSNGALIKGVATDSAGTTVYTGHRILLPEFKGGLNAMGRYIGMNVRYPASARQQHIQGTVVLGFVVNIDGKVSDVKVINSAGDDLDNESLRVLKQVPDFTPGSVYGKKVACKYYTPITFTLAY